MGTQDKTDIEMGLDICVSREVSDRFPDGTKCLGEDTLMVIFFAVGCIIVGLIVCLLLMLLDSIKSKEDKKVEKTEVATDEVDDVVRDLAVEEVYRTLTKLDNLGKFTGKREDMDSPLTVRRGSNVMTSHERRGSNYGGSRPVSRSGSIVGRSPNASPMGSRKASLVPPSPLAAKKNDIV